MSKSKELPGWFPFALTASFIVAVAAGIKSNWGKATAATPPPPPPTPPGPPSPVQAGVLRGGVLVDWR